MDPAAVRTVAEFGIDVSAKEAVCFALLALATLDGLPGNLPAATGASRPAVLGKICPGRRKAEG
jgi:anhydro-N-acetylmuramic acid kinase